MYYLSSLRQCLVVTAVTWRERSLEMLYMAPARRQAFTELLAICGERISRSA